MTNKNKATDENGKPIPEKLIKQKLVPPQLKGFSSNMNIKNTIRRNSGRGR